MIREDYDEIFARTYCAEKGYWYLSHETYVTLTSHEVWIAVEKDGDRWEVQVSR